MSKKFKATKKDGDTLLIENKDAEDVNAPEIVPNPIVDKKRVGVDLSVLLHQAIGNVTSAAEFQSVPKIPISKVEEICSKIISLARRANITLVVCTDGKYHQFKQSVNENRSKTRQLAQDQLNELFKCNGFDERLGEAKNLMKKAAHISTTFATIVSARCTHQPHSVKASRAGGATAVPSSTKVARGVTAWAKASVSAGAVVVSGAFKEAAGESETSRGRRGGSFGGGGGEPTLREAST
ncbi:hypothetical protein ACHAWF_016390 [Thalassiosira exigua]